MARQRITKLTSEVINDIAKETVEVQGKTGKPAKRTKRYVVGLFEAARHILPVNGEPIQIGYLVPPGTPAKEVSLKRTAGGLELHSQRTAESE